MNREYIYYTGKSESFTALDIWQNGKFITHLRSSNFEFEIREIEILKEKYFRVSVYHKGNNFLFGINCDEIDITKYICNDAGEIISKEERALKIE